MKSRSRKTSLLPVRYKRREDINLREFNLYVDVNSVGKMSIPQQEQFEIIVNALLDRRINLHWLIDGNILKTRQLLNILKCIHSTCKEKSVIVHNEVCLSGKTSTAMARMLVKHIPVSVYSDKRIYSDDYDCLRSSNKPMGCVFNSCLGNTMYLNKDAQLSVCPHASEIHLNALNHGNSITEAFETTDFKEFLLAQIHKRDDCKNNCQLFALCHGGCPAQKDDGECSIRLKANEKCPSEASQHNQTIKHLADMYRG